MVTNKLIEIRGAVLSKKVKGYDALCLLMLSDQFYEKWVSVRERNIKLLPETVTYIATTSHLHNYNRNSHVHNAL